MVDSFRSTLAQWSAIRLSGDLFVSTVLDSNANEGRIDQRYWAAVSVLPGVARSIPYFETSSSISAEDVVVGGVDLTVQCSRGVYPFLQGGCEAGSAAWKRRAIVSESAARKLKLSVGDTFELNELSYTVSGVVQEFSTEQPLVVINQDDFLELYPTHNPKSITIDLADLDSLATVRQQLESIAPHTLVVRDHEQLLGLVRDIFNRTFRVTESVRWIVFSIAMLGIVSTSMQHLWGRRRDFKTALVIGVSRKTLAGAVALESAACLMVALSVGLVAGALIGWCLTAYINPLVFGWSLVFSLSGEPFVEALLFSAFVVIATFFCAWAGLKSVVQRINLADE
jgi:putative ABC transport system permease protein